MLKKINFNEFEKADKKDWLLQIEKDLKGKPLSILEKELEEGININSINSAEDINQPLNIGRENSIWNFAESFSDKTTNQEILESLNRGINEISIPYSNQFQNQLKEVNPDFISINVYTNSFEDLNGITISEGAIANDVFDRSLQTGENISEDILNNWKSGFLSASTKYKKAKTLCVDNLHVQEAGATSYLQIASIFSAFADYLNLLPEDEVIPALNRSFVRIGLSKNYFLEISKIRALQYLWPNFCKAYTDKKVNCLYILAQTSTSDLTRVDEKTNLLRLTTQAISGVLGGANAISIQPFDTLNQTSSALAKRASINIHHLLKEESNLHVVTDAAKGSYFIESLTKEIAEKSWQKFLEIEKEGGYIKSLKDGWFQHEILGNATAKIAKVKAGDRTIIGVNKFENNLEPKPSLQQQNDEDGFTPIVKIPKVNYAADVEFEKTLK